MLIEVAPQVVSDVFIATRLLGQRGATAGAMAQADVAPILARLGQPA
jgi:putative acyl-CoA dehydrogenase